jgi:hypothetical protein
MLDQRFVLKFFYCAAAALIGAALGATAPDSWRAEVAAYAIAKRPMEQPVRRRGD